MPYIKLNDRVPYQDAINELVRMVPDDNASRSDHLKNIILRFTKITYGDKMRYCDHNEVMGFLQGVRAEFHRRIRVVDVVDEISPLVKEIDFKVYMDSIEKLSQMVPQDRESRPGHMNYITSRLIQLVYGHVVSVTEHDNVMKFLEDALAEFYDQCTAPYEDTKIVSEGDLDKLP